MGRKSSARNNLQDLYKLKNKFKLKTRKRKFKSRVLNGAGISSRSRRLGLPVKSRAFALRADNACRVRYDTFIGAEKALMATKSKVWIKYRKYPNFFVTKKSTKSRMGKGKGKILGRILKIQKGEAIFDIRMRHPLKSKKWVTAVRRALPTTVTLVPSSHFVAKVTQNFFRRRPWMSFKPKKKKRPFWAKKLIPKGFYRYGKMTKQRFYTTRQELPLDVPLMNFIEKLWTIVSTRHKWRGSVDYSRRWPRKRLGANPHLATSYENARGGGQQRCGYLKRYSLLTYTRRTYEAIFTPDSDGYTGIYRAANRMMKEKRARDLEKLGFRKAPAATTRRAGRSYY